MAGYKFEVCGSGESFWVRVVAGNGQTVLTSETYTTRQNAERAIAAVIEAVTEKIRQSLHQSVVVLEGDGE